MRRILPFRISLAASALLLITSAATPASAQIFKKIGDRAKESVERKAEQKINQKIDEATSKLVDRTFDSIFEDDKPTGSGGGGSSNNGGSRGGGGSKIFSRLPNAPTEARSGHR